VVLAGSLLQRSSVVDYEPSHDSQSLRTNTKVDQAGVDINPEAPQKVHSVYPPAERPGQLGAVS